MFRYRKGNRNGMREAADRGLVLVELEHSLERADGFLSHEPFCPSRVCGECTCIRFQVSELLSRVRDEALV